jgi:NMD protein affecting ribosome stability and mRNA decay
VEPDTVDVSICPTRHYKLQSSWQSYEYPHTVIDAIVEQSELQGEITRGSHNLDRLRHKTGNTFNVTIDVKNNGETTTLPVSVKVRESPARARQHPSQKAATVQIRNVDKADFEAIDSLLRSLDEDAALISVENADSGIDLVFGRDAEAKTLQDSVVQALGGTTKESRTLHTVDHMSSKRVYRSTYLVRLLPFQEDDVISHNDDFYLVISVGRSIRVKDLQTGKNTRLPAAELKEATVLSKSKVSVAETTQGDNVLHPETYQMEAAENPLGFDIVAGQTVTVVAADNRVVIVND